MIIKDKILTEKDVRNLNAEKNSVVILKNTAGQSVDVLKKLSDNVCIKIIKENMCLFLVEVLE